MQRYLRAATIAGMAILLSYFSVLAFETRQRQARLDTRINAVAALYDRTNHSGYSIALAGETGSNDLSVNLGDTTTLTVNVTPKANFGGPPHDSTAKKGTKPFLRVTAYGANLAPEAISQSTQPVAAGKVISFAWLMTPRASGDQILAVAVDGIWKDDRGGIVEERTLGDHVFKVDVRKSWLSVDAATALNAIVTLLCSTLGFAILQPAFPRISQFATRVFAFLKNAVSRT